MPPQGAQHRYLCDVLLLVQTFAPTHIEVRYAGLAGAAFHLAREHRGGCHRILPHTNRPRRRGRNPGPGLEANARQASKIGAPRSLQPPIVAIRAFYTVNFAVLATDTLST